MKIKSSLLLFTIIVLCGCSTSVRQPSSFVSTLDVSSTSEKTSSSLESNYTSYIVPGGTKTASMTQLFTYGLKQFIPYPYQNIFYLKYDNENNSYAICGYEPAGLTRKRVELPAYCDGVPVTEIAPFAFFGCKTISELVISENINKIYPSSLSRDYRISVVDENPYYCICNYCLCNKDVTEMIWMIGTAGRLTIPTSVKVINESFWNHDYFSLEYLRQIIVEEGNEMFASFNGILFNKDMTKLIHVPETISGDLFIPSTVKDINLDILERCKGIKNIIVEEGNPVFSSQDGILFKGNFEELIYQPLANETTSLVLPENVKAINWKLKNLKLIVLSDGIEKICDQAFQGCDLSVTLRYNDCEYIRSRTNKHICLYKNSDRYVYPDDVVAGSVPVHDECKFIIRPSNSLYTQNNPYLYADESGVYSQDKKIVYHSYNYQLLPETVKYSDDYNVPGGYLGELYRPKYTIKIGKDFDDLDRFLSMVKLVRTVEFYEGSNYYLVENGMLLNKDKTVLYRYNGESSEVTIPSTVKKIIPFAFWGTDVNKVVLNEGLEEIGNQAFAMLSGITEINFPNSLVSIGELAFFNCRLSTIRLGENIKYIGRCAFANDFSTINEIYLSSENAKIDYLAFSRPIDCKHEQQYVFVHLAFDSVSCIQKWDTYWCGFYSWVDSYDSLDLQSGYIRSYSVTYDNRYLIDWNHSLS